MVGAGPHRRSWRLLCTVCAYPLSEPLVSHVMPVRLHLEDRAWAGHCGGGGASVKREVNVFFFILLRWSLPGKM